MHEQGTFGHDALHGIFYSVQCRRCRHHRYVSAKRLVAAGLADVRVVGSQPRWKCPQCKNKGAYISLHGHWTGPEWSKPADYADTVEDRIPQPSDAIY